MRVDLARKREMIESDSRSERVVWEIRQKQRKRDES